MCRRVGFAAHAAWRRAWLNRVSLALVIAGVLLHSGLLVQRWLAAGYLPVTNLFATLFFFSWALALTFLYFELRYRLGASGLFVMLLNLLLLGSALPRDLKFPADSRLDTPLFELHIIFSFTGYAMFAMAFALGVLYLFQARLDSTALPDLLCCAASTRRRSFSASASSPCAWSPAASGRTSPGATGSPGTSRRLVVPGLALLRRDVPRQVRAPLAGGVYAWLSIAGFGVVLFTYLGIGLLLESNHPLE